MRRKVPLLRGLAILVVLIGHAALWGMEPLRPALGQELELALWPRIQYEVLAALAELSYFSVPAFFFVAGLFCTFAIQKTGIAENWTFIRARLKGLLVPLSIWSLLAFAAAWVMGIPSMSTYLTSRLELGQIEWGYFFPLAMVQMYLLAPLLVDQSRRRPGAVLLAGVVIQLVAIGFRMAGSLGGVMATVPTLGAAPGNYALWRWAAYVAAGIVAGLHASEIERWLKSRRRMLWAVVGVSTVLMLIEGHVLAWATQDAGWIASQTRPGVVLFAFSFVALYFSLDITPRPATRFIEKLGALSFALFLVHPIWFRLLHHLSVYFAPTFIEHQPLLMSLFYLVVGAVPCGLALSWVFRSRFRGTAVVVFGH